MEATTYAKQILQQITEPTPVDPSSLKSAAAPPSFDGEIQSMLYAFGDSRRPLLETAKFVGDIVRCQMVAILFRCVENSHCRGAGGVVGVEDVAFLMRKNPIKVQRFVKYLTVKDVTGMATRSAEMLYTNSENKRAKRCKDFLVSIDGEGGILSQVLQDDSSSLCDEARLDRLRRLERYSRDLDERRYVEFVRARQVSFLGSNMKFAAKFQQWILTPPLLEHIDAKLDKSGLEALAYLAYETVGELVEMALLVRRDCCSTMDPVARRLPPLSYNTHFPMILSGTTTEDLNKSTTDSNVWTSPLQIIHFKEVLRRLGQSPASTLTLFSKPSPTNYNSLPLIAL